jgi:hypothetical protein
MLCIHCISDLLEWVSQDKFVINAHVLQEALKKETDNGQKHLDILTYNGFMDLIKMINIHNDREKQLLKLVAQIENFHIYDCPDGKTFGGSSWAYITKKASSFLSSVKKSISSKVRDEKTKKKASSSSTKKQEEPKKKTVDSKKPTEPKKKNTDSSKLKVPKKPTEPKKKPATETTKPKPEKKVKAKAAAPAAAPKTRSSKKQ